MMLTANKKTFTPPLHLPTTHTQTLQLRLCHPITVTQTWAVPQALTYPPAIPMVMVFGRWAFPCLRSSVVGCAAAVGPPGEHPIAMTQLVELLGGSSMHRIFGCLVMNCYDPWPYNPRFDPSFGWSTRKFIQVKQLPKQGSTLGSRNHRQPLLAMRINHYQIWIQSPR